MVTTPDPRSRPDLARPDLARPDVARPELARADATRPGPVSRRHVLLGTAGAVALGATAASPSYAAPGRSVSG